MAALAAPAAVRMVDLEAPLTDLDLSMGLLGEPYASLLLVARLDGAPLGAAALLLDGRGGVSRDRLAGELRRQLEPELRVAFGRRGIELPASLPRAGVPARARDEDAAPTRSVSVVVTTCADPMAIERCLRSVLASDYDDFEVIVVENRPRASATPAMLAERFAGESRLHYVEEPARGLSRARNAGLALAQGDVVAFTDDDVVVDPGWVRECAAAFDRPGDIACVTGLILPRALETDSQLRLEQFCGFGKGFERRTWRLPDARESDPLLPYTPGVIGSGANTVLRADVAAELRGFDTSLGAGTPGVGGEDLDLYIRLLQQGRAVAYEPSAIVWHEHSSDGARLPRQVYRYGVGLGATLAKQLVAGPERRRLLGAVPAGIHYVRDPASRKNASKAPDYPRRLEWLERFGMLVGPAAYIVSALATATRARTFRGGDGTPMGGAPAGEHLILSSGETVKLVDVGPPPAAPQHPAAPRPDSERAMVAAAAAACVTAPLAVALGLPAALRFPAVLVFLCLVPGTALVTALRGRVEPGLALGAGLACSVVVAQSMLSLSAWHPRAFLYGVAAVCLAPLLFRLDPGRRTMPATAGERIREALAKMPRAARGHVALVSVAVTAWGLSLAGADLTRMNGVGLLAALPPTYYAAFALLIVGFAVAVTRDEISAPVLWLYVLALILVLHGTTPLLYDEPRYPWVYKHIAAIDFIAQGGGVDRHIDIYNNWPGFFAVNAWLSDVGGVGPAAYAPWAQVFFNLADVVALRFALRGLTSDERLLWTATWLFVLGNWIGQDYLAPQAFAFLLSLVVLGLCLRCGRPPVPSRAWITRRSPPWLRRLRTVVLPHPRVSEPLPAAPLSPRAAVVVGGLCYLAIVVSHQLTPVILIVGLTALALMTRRVPLWIPAAMALVEIWWMALAWPYFSQHYSIVDFNPNANGVPSGYSAGDGLPGLVLVSRGARAELALIAALAVIGLIRRMRAGRWDLAAAVLVVAPLFVVAAQSYSGEGRYRFYLFALPWVSFFAAAACSRISPAQSSVSVRPWRVGLASGALGACLLLAYFGLDLSNRVTRDDVAAAVWFDEHAPRDSVLVEVTSNAISRATGRYARVFDPHYPGSPTLTALPDYRHRKLGPKDLPRLEATLRGYGVPHTFLVLSPSQEGFARLYGILPSGWRRSLERTLTASRRFRLVYRRGSSSIFRYTGPVR